MHVTANPLRLGNTLYRNAAGHRGYAKLDLDTVCTYI